MDEGKERKRGGTREEVEIVLEIGWVWDKFDIAKLCLVDNGIGVGIDGVDNSWAVKVKGDWLFIIEVFFTMGTIEKLLFFIDPDDE